MGLPLLSPFGLLAQRYLQRAVLGQLARQSILPMRFCVFPGLGTSQTACGAGAADYAMRIWVKPDQFDETWPDRTRT